MEGGGSIESAASTKAEHDDPSVSIAELKPKPHAQPYEREHNFVARHLSDQQVLALNLDKVAFFWDLLDKEALADMTELVDEEPLDVFYIFFHLLVPRCSDVALRAILIKKLNGLVFNTTYIKAYCSLQHWIPRGILFLESDCAESAYELGVEVLTLIQIVGLFSITPHELKLLFTITRRATWAQKYWGLLVSLLNRLSLPREGPDSFFDFTARDSGLLLPSKKWPQRGTTFFTWLRVESLEDPIGFDTTNYRPRLYSFLTDEGEGTEAYFLDGRLTVKTKLKNRAESQSMKFLFEPKKWYFILLSHEYRRIGRSKLSLFVNNEHVETHSLIYPRIDQVLTKCHLGSNEEVNSLNEEIEIDGVRSTKKRPQPFFGQLGDVYLISGSMTPLEAEMTFKLGVNFIPLSSDTNDTILTGQKRSVFLVDKKFIGKIVFCHSPKAMDRMLSLDTSCGKTKNTATKMSGVKVWTTKSVHDIIDTVGGVKNILALFGPRKLQMKPDEDPAPIFMLLYSIAQHSPELFKEMHNCSMFQIVGYLMEEVDPKRLTEDSLLRVDQLAALIMRTFGPSELFGEMIKHIFMNFAIWIRAEVNVQRKLLGLLAEYSRKWPQFFRDQVGVESIIEIMHLFYSFIPIKDPKMRVSKARMEASLKHREITEIRNSFLSILITITEGNLKPEEVLVIIGYLRHSYEEQAADILTILSFSLLQHFGMADQQVEKGKDTMATYFIELWENCAVKQTPNYPKKVSVPLYIAYTRPTAKRKWKKLIRDIENDDIGSADYYWKLDNAENECRMKRKLKRCHAPLLHIGCAKPTNTNNEVLTEESFVMVTKEGEEEEAGEGGKEEEEPLVQEKHQIVIGAGISLAFSSEEPKDVFREGFLIKQGAQIRNWKTRFFILSQSQLHYKLDGKLMGTIPLESATVTKNEEEFSQEYCFKIITDNRTYLLCADTRIEMEEWMRDIRRAIPKKEKPPPDPMLPPFLQPKEEDDEEVTLSFTRSEELIHKTSCSLVTPMDVISGVLEITGTQLQFFASKNKAVTRALAHRKEWRWPIDTIRSVYRRMFLLRNSALELFMIDRTNIFLNFPAEETLKVLTKLVNLHPPHMTNCATLSPDKLVVKSKLTTNWQARKISNFEYLMALNTLSGRTFNDLNQYPVFPWIIADYTSESLDLTKPESFRDLSKPVGALEPERLKQYLERYKHFDDPSIPKFLYGTHYSSAGSVLFYLMRLEPFTSYCVQLGDGRFDVPERMFTSISRTWNGCLFNNNNVKELIPEFFFLPEIFANTNRVDFGSTVEGKVGDVVLPPWAKTPEEFIRINKEALESDYVSQHLHEWVDLIFGYKQRGEEAEKADNVFFYLTYPGMVDIDKIEDPIEKRSIEAQILNFGQCPTQLFYKPHPKRWTREETAYRSKNVIERTTQGIYSAFSAIYDNLDSALSITSPPPPEKRESGGAEDGPSASPSPLDGRVRKTLFPIKLISGKFAPIVSILCCSEHVLVIFWDGTVAFNTFIRKNQGQRMFEIDKALEKPQQKQLDILISRQHINNVSNCFALLGDGKLLLTCGSWDRSFRVHSIQPPSTVRLAQTFFREHNDIISCLAFTDTALVTASVDGQVKVWDMLIDPGKEHIFIKHKHTLSGHTGSITCTEINYAEDVIVSGSTDNTIRIFTLQQGRHLRTLKFQSTPQLVKISGEGYVVIACDSMELFSHTLNGRQLATTKLSHPITAMVLSFDGTFVITGIHGAVTVRSIHNLEVVISYEMPSTVRSLACSTDGRSVFAGLENGELFIVPLPVGST